MTEVRLPSGRSWDPGTDPYAYQMAASDNRDEVLGSEVCGCIGCGAMFAPAEIVRWWDEGTTACCPRCSLASVVIGSASGLALDEECMGLARAHLLGAGEAPPPATAVPTAAAKPWWRFW